MLLALLLLAQYGAPKLPTTVGVPVTTYTPAQPFSETWANTNEWTTTGSSATTPAWPGSLKANDGLMGGAFYRFGNDNYTGATGYNMVGPLFDQRYAYEATYNARITMQNGTRANWIGFSLLYSAESQYGGGLGTFAWSAAQMAGQVDNIAGATAISNTGVFAVDTKWDPVAGNFKTKIGANAFATGTALSGWVNVVSLYPQSMWWGAYADAQTVDVGPITVTGHHLWGAQDDYGWGNWLISANVARLSAADENTGCLGGLTGKSATGETWAYEGGSTSPTARSLAATTLNWDAASTIAGIPSTYHYVDLRLHVVNYRPQQIEVYVRYASGGTSVFSARDGGDQDVLMTAKYIPTNAVATAQTGVANTRDGTLSIDLSGVVSPIYLDVRGHTDSAYGKMADQPRLGGAWISYSQ